MAVRVVQWTTGNVGQAVGPGRRRPPRPRAGRAATPGRPTRSAATSASCAASTRSASPPPTTSTPCSRCSPTASSTTRCGPTPTSSSASSRPASTSSAPPRSSTAAALGADRDRIVEACERGGSSMFGTGISPGFVELIGIATAEHLRPDRQDHHRRGVRHHPLRLARHRAARAASAGRSTTPSCRAWPPQGTAVFGEAVAMVADALGVELDEIVCEAEYAKTTEDVVMDSWTIAAGCVAGVARQLAGQGRRPHRRRAQRPLEEGPDPRARLARSRRATSSRSTAGPRCGPSSSTCPPPDFEATTFADFMVLGMIMTAMPAINAIPYVVAAPPGIVTYTDLPLPLPRGLVPG